MAELELDPVRDDEPPALTPWRRTMVLVAMCLALVLVVAGVTMLVNALALVAESLDLSQSEQSWLLDAYALPFAGLLLIAGALGDRYGRRGALLAGTALFGAGSLLSALADTGNELLGYRAITGVGAALIMPGTLSTITSVFPPAQRARAVGVWSGFAMGGGTIGLVGSGLLLQSFSWTSIFFVAAALAAVCFVAIALAVPATRSSAPVSLDPGGTALSALGVGGIVFGIIEGPERGWTSSVTVGALVAGLAALAAFVWWELRVDQPLLDPRLFRLRGFGTGAAGLLVMFVAIVGFMVMAIQYLQLVLGYSPLKAAVGQLPQMVMIPLAAVAAQLAVRFGQRRMTTLGLVVSALGMAWFLTLDAGSGYWHFAIGMVLVAAGMGLAMTPATTAIIDSLPRAKQGVASAVNDTAREIGAALGVAVLGSAVTTAYRADIAGHLDGLPAETAAGAREAPAIALESARELGPRGADLAAAAQDAFMSGFRNALLIAGGLLAAAALYTWWRGPSPKPATAAATAPATDGEDLDRRPASPPGGEPAIEPILAVSD